MFRQVEARLKISDCLIENASTGRQLIGTWMHVVQTIVTAETEFEDRGKSMPIAIFGISHKQNSDGRSKHGDGFSENVSTKRRPLVGTLLDVI